MTLGQIRLRIRQLQVARGTTTDVLDGFISSRYQRILDRLPWRRLDTESILQVPDSYSTGTVAATRGSATITGTGTVWTTAMNGLVIRLNTSNDETASSGEEYYQVTDVDGDSITLDRPYENDTVTAAGYRIDQNFFLLPSSLRIMQLIRPLHDRATPLEIISPAELSRIAPHRTEYGTPRWAAFSWDSQNDPPTPQVELYPIPSSPNSAGITLSFGVQYTYDPTPLTDTAGVTDTATSLLPWTRPDAIVAGVANDLAMDKAASGDQSMIAVAALYKTEYNERVAELLSLNAQTIAPERMRMGAQYLGTRPGRFVNRSIPTGTDPQDGF